MTSKGFRDNQKEAQKVIEQTNTNKRSIETFEEMDERLDNLEVLYELIKEENDQDLYDELEEEVSSLQNDINDFELEMLLSEPYDANNAILELHPGAGGTESQDWASQLLRMYQRWAEQNNYSVETLNYLPGDEAGVKV